MNVSELVKEYDPENQFSVLKNSFEQIEFVKNNIIDLSSVNISKISNVVITGLGGSAIGGDLFKNFASNDFPLPIIVNRNYSLPKFINESTLVIISSYSGNTEETIAALEEAYKKCTYIICLTTGGKIEQFATEKKLNVVKLKKGYQPRFALFSNVFTLIKVFGIIGLIPKQDEFIDSAIKLFKQRGESLSADDNSALKKAEKLLGFIPFIYAVEGFNEAAGLRLKGEFNENSKLLAYYNVFPELNHNEIVGWETFNPSQFNAKVILLNDVDYQDRIKKRIDVTSELIRKTGAEIITISSNLNTFKERLFDIVYFGDWVSYYLALLRKKDPSEIDNIYYLKDQLSKYL